MARDYKEATLRWDNNIQLYKLNFKMGDSTKFKALVDIIKTYIPSHERSFDTSSKTWLFAETAYDAVRAIVEATFARETGGKYTIYDKDQYQKEWSRFQQPVKVTDNSSELQKFRSLLQDAGWPLLDSELQDKNAIVKKYRRALMVLHPDRNPANADKCSQLNATFQNLQNYFGFEQRQMEQIQ